MLDVLYSIQRFLCPTSHLHNMLPAFVPWNVATACIPVHSRYQRRLHLWSSITDAFLLLYHCDTLSNSSIPAVRNLMHSIRVAERDTPPVRSFQTISLRKFLSKIPLLIWRTAFVPLYVVATFLLVLQDAISVYRDNPFSGNFCNTEL